MITFDINDIFPQFILRDRTGYAMAKALEAGLNYFLTTAQTGLETVLDPDKMPEWRLDEMAWELDCIYDYQADVETKRGWIKSALPYYSIYGTKEIVRKYLLAVYDNVVLEEAWEYEGDPFHFRVIVDGVYTADNDAWAKSAIAKTKNVRSVLDTVSFNGGESTANEKIGAAVVGMEIQVHSVTV